MPNPLTPRQRSVLTTLRKNGEFPGNWYIDSPEYTRYVLTICAIRGLVTCVDGVFRIKEDSNVEH